MHFYIYSLDSLKSVFNVFRTSLGAPVGAPVVKREFKQRLSGATDDSRK